MFKVWSICYAKLSHITHGQVHGYGSLFSSPFVYLEKESIRGLLEISLGSSINSSHLPKLIKRYKMEKDENVKRIFSKEKHMRMIAMTMFGIGPDIVAFSLQLLVVKETWFVTCQTCLQVFSPCSSLSPSWFGSNFHYCHTRVFGSNYFHSHINMWKI